MTILKICQDIMEDIEDGASLDFEPFENIDSENLRLANEDFIDRIKFRKSEVDRFFGEASYDVLHKSCI